jgi:tRNA threonylcarbamoyl adenosine modification protein YeaZ
LNLDPSLEFEQLAFDPSFPMSSILAIETSTPTGSVAVVCDDEVRFERTFTSERSHNSQLFAPLREALDACGPSLRAIVVGLGPASYTGVRIGIAAAQGLALSRNIPVVCLPSVLAADVDSTPRFSLCGDARRGSFFVAEVIDGALAAEIVTMEAEDLHRRHAESHDSAPWFTFDARPPLALPGVQCVSPSASRLAKIAAPLSDEKLQQLAQLPLEPIYLSAPFVTMPGK